MVEAILKRVGLEVVALASRLVFSFCSRLRSCFCFCSFFSKPLTHTINQPRHFTDNPPSHSLFCSLLSSVLSLLVVSQTPRQATAMPFFDSGANSQVGMYIGTFAASGSHQSSHDKGQACVRVWCVCGVCVVCVSVRVWCVWCVRVCVRVWCVRVWCGWCMQRVSGGDSSPCPVLSNHS